MSDQIIQFADGKKYRVCLAANILPLIDTSRDTADDLKKIQDEFINKIKEQFRTILSEPVYDHETIILTRKRIESCDYYYEYHNYLYGKYIKAFCYVGFWPGRAKLFDRETLTGNEMKKITVAISHAAVSYHTDRDACFRVDAGVKLFTFIDMERPNLCTDICPKLITCVINIANAQRIMSYGSR